jgi:hypothetical protein
MTIYEPAQRIMDKLYSAYGSDSGILFGISSSKVVGVIVQFTLEQFRDEIKKLLQDTTVSPDDRWGYVEDLLEEVNKTVNTDRK